jgi:FkbM family methyltransferase
MIRIIDKFRLYFSSTRFYGPVQGMSIIFHDLLFMLNKYLLHKNVLKRRIHDYQMHLSVSVKGISNELYVHGHREDDNREILRRELKPGDKVLDIGANIGYYALMEAMIIGDEGIVYAVEPDQRNLMLLKENITLNRLEKSIQVFDKAISNKNGFQQFAIHQSSNLNVILPKGGYPASEQYMNIVRIETVDIYDFLKSLERINLIRMDLEGHEQEVLEGIIRFAVDCPHNVPEKILFEAHPALSDEHNQNMKKVLRKLFRIGYSVRTVTVTDENQSDEMKKSGYSPWRIVKSDFLMRGIFDNISAEDAVRFIYDCGFIRTVLLVQE